jgi:phospholipase/lecithinase/hemolysin
MNFRTIFCSVLMIIPGAALAQTTWKLRYQPPPTFNLSSIGYGNGRFVAVGYSYPPGPTPIVTSADGVSWQELGTGRTNAYYAVAYGNGHFVIVGNGSLTSSDGLHWTQAASINYLNTIAFGNGQFVASGYSRTLNDYVLMTSLDGTEWTLRKTGYQYGLSTVTYGKGRFVGVTGSVGTIVTSTDGSVWDLQPFNLAGTNSLFGITYGSGQFVAVGGSSPGFDPGPFRHGTIVTSDDGLNWALRWSSETNGLGSVAYGNGQFVAGPRGGLFLTSSNGEAWDIQKAGRESWVNALTYGNGHFVGIVDGSIQEMASPSEPNATGAPFTSLYFFGFSWTDTHNCAAQWPGPKYYNGRASNGPLWPEYLSTNLGIAYVEGNNYAVCGAEPTQILDQVKRFTPPQEPALAAYFMWLGDSDDVLNGVFHEDIATSSNTVDRLYQKGAREIVIETHLDDTGKVPGYVSQFGTNSIRYSQNTAELNRQFLTAIDSYLQTKPDLRIVFVDMFSSLDQVIAQPDQFGLTKVDIAALDDMALADHGFTGPGSSYMFWDSFHATTKVHKLMADWHLAALTNAVLEKLEAVALGPSIKLRMNHLRIGREYALQSSSDLKSWSDVESFVATAGTNQWAGPRPDRQAAFFWLKWVGGP